MNNFDRAFWKSAWSLVRLYWVSPQRRPGVKLLVYMAALSGVGLALGAYVTYLERDIMNALVAKNLHAFYRLMVLAAGMAATGVLCKVFGDYAGGLLYIEWREWLTHYFVDRGFAHRAFYRMALLGKVDNPDQRISDDINSFVGSTETFTFTFAFAIAGIVTYSAILWSISAALALVLVSYAIAGTYLSVVIGRRLIGLNYRQERYQADFRFGLVHVRDNIEPIFLYGGEGHETGQLRRRFDKVVANFKQLVLWKRNLGFFTESYGAIAHLIPYWVLAGAYVAGRIQFGQMVQAGAVFLSLHGALSVIVTNFPSLAEYANVAVRLSEFLDEAGAAGASEAESVRKTAMVEGPRVALEHLTVLTPAGDKTLIKDLTADASALEPLLIQGPSGTGKTSLIRAMAGLWREGGGTVNRPALSEVMFLPQRPYLILGSLRDQLTYPRAAATSDQELYDVLRAVNLADLPERFGGLDTEMHWADVLSPGEQQMLAFGRLLLNRPRFALLDEATSALDVPNEQRMYDLLRRRKIPFLSSGHRPTLRRFHRNILQLSPNHVWKIDPSSEFEPLTSAA